MKNGNDEENEMSLTPFTCSFFSTLTNRLPMFLICLGMAGCTDTQVLTVFAYGWAAAHPIETVKMLAEAPAKKRQEELRRMTYAQCEKELKDIPSAFDIDEFIDEGAHINSKLILDMLARRKVRKIYVKLRFPRDGNKLLFFGGTMDGDWTIPNVSSDKNINHSYVMLSLADRGSGTCFGDKKMPYNFRNGIPPLLPNVCLSVVPSERPQGKHALIYKPAPAIDGVDLGHWMLVNEATGQQLASLSSRHDMANSFYDDQGCVFPYHILTNRIRPAHPVPDDLTVGAVTRKPSLDPDKIAGENLLTLIPREDLVEISERERKTYFGYGWEAWDAAVRQALRDGYGSYESKLLDWKNRTLVSLDLSGKHHNYNIHPGDKGFYVLSSKEWNKTERLVAHYDHNGIFEWAINIQVPRKYCRLYPDGILTTESAIAFYFVCNKNDGHILELPTDVIPFLKALREKTG
jgi:hypothetical protein